MKKKLTYQILALTTLVGITIVLFYNRYTNSPSKAKRFIEEIREKNKEGLDSLQRAINYENDLDYRIRRSISTGDFLTAYTLMDSLPPFGKAHSIHLYKGMIYTEQKKYTEAVLEYTKAINELPFSKAKSLRAEVYIRMNKPELALTDYQSVYAYNHSYSVQVANTFMLMNKKDSALKYYQIYLEHYPDDTVVQKKVNLLLASQ